MSVDSLQHQSTVTELGSRILLLGIPIDTVTLEEAVQNIQRMIREFPNSRKAGYVATINVDFLVNSVGWSSARHQHPELVQILRHADLALADGMPLVWLSKALGCPLQERVAGSDLALSLAQALSLKGGTLFLLGGAEGTAEAAGERLMKQFPGLQVAGTSAPKIHVTGAALANEKENDAALVEQINAVQPDVLYLGLGNPKQELWFQRVRKQLQVPVTIGLGGTFDFISGRTSRAPVWMRERGLEWIFRWTQEPRRLSRRYLLGLCKISWLCLPLLWLRLKSCITARNDEKTVYEVGWEKQCLPSRPTAQQLLTLAKARANGEITSNWDASRVKNLSPRALAVLVTLRPDAVQLKNPSRALKRQLRIARIADWTTPLFKKISPKREASYTVHPFPMWREALTYETVERARQVLERSQAEKLDLSQCDELDNSGVCLLMELAKTQNMHVVNPHPAVKQALRLANVETDVLSNGFT